MDLIDQIAERHIERARARGELDDLPGSGKPLPTEDLAMVPEHLRAGYRLLKGAGFIPPEIETLRQIRDTEALIARVEDPQARAEAARRLRLLETRLSEGRGHGLNAVTRMQYQDALNRAFSDREGD
ncbi:DnaJ family domain-containing protein [Marichromatium gracile]|uniref:Uncharacterized protein DUF1992 n=1 Tax=Marichromatium gracile TaxID=1048 RepID=A0A4R4A563_MARGR|nr:DnaJ family domain-containing protein [Marichromatium gracile]MBK1710211.1 molecular chaperone DnaJ [Marichromatium gracile]MBO8086707.1 DUF1992 domain-containing protein [Marichromatium sp.]TCW33354.1 uncharacterized protein DUF1992 [Marichromatium gracile]